MNSNQTKTNWGHFLPLVIVFFFWGFVAASNDILIPVFKKAFNISHLQSQLVTFAFYVAYTVGSLLYMLVSKVIGIDLINKLGYRNSLALGLFIAAIGTFLFYPAVELHSYTLMLSGLFIIGLGMSLQQTVANPLAISMGSITTGSQRLTLAGGVNNLGTTIGPLIVSFAIFGSAIAADKSSLSLEGIKAPYIILGLAFLVFALFLKYSGLPDKPAAIEEAESHSDNSRSSAFQYPQLVMGMIAIFLYVGVEVATASNLPGYMEELGYLTKDVAPYISLYWASLMIGRWTGGVEAFNASASVEKILKFIAPYAAFGVFLFVNSLAKNDVTHFYIYGLVVIVLILADIASKGSPAKMLLIFSVLGLIGLVIGMLTTGLVSIYAFTSVGLFCSTLWPCIFTLAISGLGNKTSEGSNYLVMMIMGGAFVSLLQGYVSEFVGIHYSYIVGVACFAYLAFYAWKVTDILRNQGINFDKKISGGH
jgi:MFS transporter, FHS family, L-fucose permease